MAANCLSRTFTWLHPLQEYKNLAVVWLSMMLVPGGTIKTGEGEMFFRSPVDMFFGENKTEHGLGIGVGAVVSML